MCKVNSRTHSDQLASSLTDTLTLQVSASVNTDSGEISLSVSVLTYLLFYLLPVCSLHNLEWNCIYCMFVLFCYNCSWLSITRPFKGNPKRFKLAGVKVIKRWEQMSGIKHCFLRVHSQFSRTGMFVVHSKGIYVLQVYMLPNFDSK